MAARPTVLVVASKPAMLRSLRFALEAEGYEVDTVTQLAECSAPDCGCVEVVIIDQDALVDPANPAAELAGIDHPVILLVERMKRKPSRARLRVIEKPPLGRDLLDAVADAVGRSNLRTFP